MSTPVIERVNVVQPVQDLGTFEELFPFEETSDPAVRAHIVNPPKNLHIWKPGMSSKEIVDIARMTQQEVEALCGYRFVPKHNPDKFDACEKCMKIAADIMREGGE